MHHRWTVLTLCGLLAACGDPLDKVERISDVTLAAEEPIATALPDAEEYEPEGGVFSRLLRRSQPEESAAAQTGEIPADAELTEDTTPQSEAVPPEDAAAADPAAPTESPTEALTESAPEPSAKPAGGLRGWLRRTAAAEAKADAVPEGEAAPTELASVETETTPGTDTPAEATQLVETTNADAAQPVAAQTAPADDPKPTGFLARLRAGAAAKPAAQDAPPVQTASLSPDLSASPDAVREEPGTRKRGGLLGVTRKNTPRTGADGRDVPYGTILPYGTVARVCDARLKPLGRKIGKAPARGKGYTLYDSDPESTAPRTFYITGFEDACPRQFTAALALFGAPSMHESLRYGRPSDEYPYSDTDKAYEQIKSRVCRVGKRKPCGSALPQLEKTTVFISTYERFSDNARWADILLHDGAVVAAALKTP